MQLPDVAPAASSGQNCFFLYLKQTHTCACSPCQVKPAQQFANSPGRTGAGAHLPPLAPARGDFQRMWVHQRSPACPTAHISILTCIPVTELLPAFCRGAFCSFSLVCVSVAWETAEGRNCIGSGALAGICYREKRHPGTRRQLHTRVHARMRWTMPPLLLERGWPHMLPHRHFSAPVLQAGSDKTF